MKVDHNIANLIADLEFIIGDSCYNPDSYNGHTGVAGLSYRYPVCVRRNNSLIKHRGIIKDLSPDEVDSIRYKFGTNNLYIGRGLVEVLEFLEKRYNLDFNELERSKK